MSRGRLKMIGSKFSGKRWVFAAVFAVLLVVGFFAVGQEAWGQPASNITNPKTLQDYASRGGIGLGIGLLDTLTWILTNLIMAIIGGLGYILMFFIWILVLIFSYNNFINEPIVIIGWTIVRDFMNMFFIVALMVIAFATIFKIQAYHYKQMLPKLLIAAIVVNFSKMITGVLIDAAQVVMMTFVNAFQDLAGGNFAELFGISKLLSFGGVREAVIEDNANLFSIFVSLVLAVILVIVAIAVVIVMIVMLAVRVIMLWLLTIFSPVAWVAPLLPGGEKYASQWWENLTKYLVTGCVMAFLVWLTFAGLQIQNKIATTPEIVSKENKNTADTPYFITEIGTGSHTFSFIIGIAMLFGSLLAAQQLGGIAGNFAGKMQGMLATGGKLAARYTLGSAMRKLDEKTGGYLNPVRAIKNILQSKEEKYQKNVKGAEGFYRDVGELGVRKSILHGKAAFAGLRHKRQEEAVEKELKEAQRQKIIADFAGRGGEQNRDELRTKLEGSFGQIQGLREREDRYNKYQALKTSTTPLSEPQQKKLDLYEEEFKNSPYVPADEKKSMDKAKKEFQEAYNGLYVDQSQNSDDVDLIKNLSKQNDGSFMVENYRGERRSYHEKSLDVLSNQLKDELTSKLNATVGSKVALKGGFVNDREANRRLKEIESEIEKLGKIEKEQREKLHYDTFAADTKEYKAWKGNDEQLGKLGTRKQMLNDYITEIKKGDKDKNPFELNGGLKGQFDSLDTEGQSVFKLTAKDDAELQKLKKELNDELDGSEFELTTKIKAVDMRISEEERKDLLKAYEKQMDKVKEEREKLMKSKPIRGYHSQQVARETQAEEYKKVQGIENSDELVALFREAQHEGDRFKMGAVLRKLAEGGNDNEVLNDYGYESSFQGMKQFFEKEVKQAYKGKEAEYQELASDISYFNEGANHWETSRVNKYDANKGKLVWNSEEDHVTAALAEITKLTPGRVAQFNRLAYGGEKQSGSGFKMSALGAGIVATFGKDLARSIERGYMDANAIMNIKNNWHVVQDMPSIRNVIYNGMSIKDRFFQRGELIEPLGNRVQAGLRAVGRY